MEGLGIAISDDDWEDFRDHRDKLKAPMTPRAERAIVKRLEAIHAKHGHDPVAVLDQSIRKGWKDVFELEDGSAPPPSLDREVPLVTRHDTAHLAAEIERAERHIVEAQAIMARLRAAVAPLPVPPHVIAVEHWLTPQQIAGHVKLHEGHVRKVLQLGKTLEIVGIAKHGGRWTATLAGFQAAQERARFARFPG